MTRQKKEIGVLVALFLILGAVVYHDFQPQSASDDGNSLATGVFELMPVPNPALHLGRLADIRKTIYSGNHRNIFSATPPPPPPSPVTKAKRAAASAPAVPPPPPSLRVPLTFYGIVSDPKNNRKVACFTNGDHVYIASAGDTLLGQYKLLSIGRNTVVFEDVGTGQTATLTMTPAVNQ